MKAIRVIVRLADTFSSRAGRNSFHPGRYLIGALAALLLPIAPIAAQASTATPSTSFLTAAQSNAPTANAKTPSLTLTSPVQYQLFQRDKNTDLGDIKIEGKVVNSQPGEKILASWGAGAVQVVATLTDSTQNFSGYLPQQLVGQETLKVWLATYPANAVTVTQVGVGDIFIIAGQSNAVGRGYNPTVFSGSPSKYIATYYGHDGNWQPLKDPIFGDGENRNTVWPLVGSSIVKNENIPVAFVPCAVGGSSVTQWIPSGNLYDNFILSLTAIGGKFRSILWFQGESDSGKIAKGEMTSAQYGQYLKDMQSALKGEFGGNPIIIVGQIGNLQTRADLDGVRSAQEAIVDNTTFFEGPATYDINLDKVATDSDNIHFRTVAQIRELAQRWWNSIESALYDIKPVRTHAMSFQYETSTQVLTIIFTQRLKQPPFPVAGGSLTPGQSQGVPTASAFEVKDCSGALIPIRKVALQDNQLLLTLQAKATPCTATYGSQNSAVWNALYGEDGDVVEPIYGAKIYSIGGTSPRSSIVGDGKEKFSLSLTAADTAQRPVANLPVSLSILPNTYSLGGTTRVATDSTGAANFSNLTLSGPAGVAQLVLSYNGLQWYQNVLVRAATATKLAISTQQTPVGSGTSLDPVIVRVQDVSGNTIKTSGVTVTLSTSTGNLTGATTATTVNGVAIFTGTAINAFAGARTLTASSAGYTSASSTVNVIVGDPYSLRLNFLNSTVASGGALGNQSGLNQFKAVLLDSGGNLIGTEVGARVFTGTLSVSGGAILAGGALTAATNRGGTAYFTGLTLTGSPGTVALSISAPGLATATTPITITP